MSKSRSWTEEQLREAVKESRSIRQVLGKVGLVEAGGNYAIIKWWIKKYGIDNSHFTGRGYLKGKSHGWSKKIDLADILVENSNYQSNNLRKRLIKVGLLKEECRSCNGTKWLGKNMPLELEHINGNKFDNRIENLELLCPNCHAFTTTYRGKNKG